MKDVGDTLEVFLIVGDDGLLHASTSDVPRGQEFFAACGWPVAARAPRMKADGKTVDEKPCPHCILQPS